MKDDPILDQSLVCLWPHRHAEWGDRIPLDVFNRLLAKNIRPLGWTVRTHLNIRPPQISSRQEQWTTASLGKLLRGHNDTSGQDGECPVIVVEYQGVQRLIDGAHRVNRWVAAADVRLHAVNIHTVSGVGEFIELPGASGA